MIIIMEAGIKPEDSRVAAITTKATRLGLNPVVQGAQGTEYSVTQVLLKDGTAKSSSLAEHFFQAMPGVETVQRVTPPAVSLAHKGTPDYKRIMIGSDPIATGLPCRLVAGPCTVDNQIDEVVGTLAGLGIRKVRGGCWKPRSKPDSFPGFGEKAVHCLLTAAEKHCMQAVFLEVIESEHIQTVKRIQEDVGYWGTIVLWVGARTQNPILLRKLGEQPWFPVMIKNGVHDQGIDDIAARVEWVLARRSSWNDDGSLDAANSLEPGHSDVVVCLRGTKQTDRHSQYRFIPNHFWIKLIQREWWTPVAVDPSHSAGEESLVVENTADALRYNPSLIMVEGGYNGSGYRGLCDMDQSLSFDNLRRVIDLVRDHNTNEYGLSTF